MAMVVVATAEVETAVVLEKQHGRKIRYLSLVDVEESGVISLTP